MASDLDLDNWWRWNPGVKVAFPGDMPTAMPTPRFRRVEQRWTVTRAGLDGFHEWVKREGWTIDSHHIDNHSDGTRSDPWYIFNLSMMVEEDRG